MSMSNNKLLFVIAAALLLASGCATHRSSRQQTAQALDRVLSGDHRSIEHKARDQYRHPKETLLFFGIRPEMSVVEVWPGAGGWYTEILAPLLREKGKYYVAHWEPNPENQRTNDGLAAYREKLASRPDAYDKAVVTAMGRNGADIASPESVDMVVTFRNIHNWMGQDWAPQAFTLMYRALKPGGVLGVVEHRGPDGEQDPKAKSGYVNEDYAIKLIEAAGFRLVAKSEINANTRDTKDYEQGVWTLPPTYRLGDTDREKYAAIGESDRFTLKFVKPER
ncbi:MAG: class I SAM-dependent methyltransferase [Gammaproteobacteria bacterium]